MSGSKHINKIAWIVTTVMLLATFLFMNGDALGIQLMAHTMGYENRLFDNTRVHTLDIVMNDWDTFIKNATSEEYYTAAVVIDGEAYKNVGIRGKGNTSLSSVASMNSERYSFKVEFDHFDDTRTYHGLDKLSLNNLIQDASLMKDYLTYTLMNEFDAAAPLCSFVYVTVNGEDWGLYLAVEGVEDSFLQRNYGTDHGLLYKPDSVGFGGGRGNGRDFNMENFDFGAMAGGGGMGGFGRGASDVKLQYIDDDPDSYSSIWGNAKSDITQADQKRLIEALKTLSSGEQIETAVDVEQVIRYFVVHNYVCNGDSYTGSMVHNYYLYEEDGRLAMLPWDYNLAFGTFQGTAGQSAVNTPIDSPISGGTADDRPMWSWIVNDATYTEMYHKYYKEFLETVDIEAIIDQAHDLIAPYVEKDPTAFYGTEAFEKGVESMRLFCQLRSESISMQLENEETVKNMNYVDASGLSTGDMGSMRGGMGGFGGGGMGGFGGGRRGAQETRETVPDTQTAPDEKQNEEGANAPRQGAEGFGGFGNLPEGMDPSQFPFPGGNRQTQGDSQTPGNQQNPGNMQVPGNMQIPGNMQMPGARTSGETVAADEAAGWIWIGASALILCIGLIVAKRYK